MKSNDKQTGTQQMEEKKIPLTTVTATVKVCYFFVF